MIRKLIGTIVIIGLVVVGVIWAVNWRLQNKVDFKALAEQVDKISGAGKVITDAVANEVGQPGMVDHIRGNKDAKVILVEYADMQCAGCAMLAPKMSAIVEDYGDEIGVVFRHFPVQGHPNARAAAVAIEAAGKQGKFFEMLDVMFANQATWSSLSTDKRTGEFQRLAEVAGVPDIAKWREEYAKSGQFDVKIRFDQALGNLQGVDETPTVFLNGEKLSREVAANEDKIREAIDAALAK
ncbi:MAG: DsbA family protein [Candidatus Nomurabacteria bacterium]|jgi:protein-disulfide isomerase|nr:DsbA family protein [Candidatus Nomurabacteria bacterium]